MARGKKGPRPEMKVTGERGITLIEDDFPGGPQVEARKNGVPDEPMRVAETYIPFTEPVETPVIAEQPELFKPLGVVIKYVNVSPAPEVLAEYRKALADLAQEYLAIKDAKKAADAGFNTQISEIDIKMRKIVLALKYPGQSPVECEWRVIDGNARGLYRLDTGECIAQAALTAEDRAAELDEANDMNEVPF